MNHTPGTRPRKPFLGSWKPSDRYGYGKARPGVCALCGEKKDVRFAFNNVSCFDCVPKRERWDRSASRILFESGAPVSEIAKQAGITEHTLRQYAWVNKWRRPGYKSSKNPCAWHCRRTSATREYVVDGEHVFMHPACYDEAKEGGFLDP